MESKYYCRCVADEQRTLALGAQSVAFRAFGSIPGPILFGAIFDSACVYWQFECSRRGNCWVYNNVHLSQRALILALLGIAANFIFSFLSWLFYPKQTAAEKAETRKILPSSHSQLGDNEMEVSNAHPGQLSTERINSLRSQDNLLNSEL